MFLKRQNLVFESIRGEDEQQIKAKIIQIADRLGATVYQNKIEEVIRMERRDEKDLRPGPV